MAIAGGSLGKDNCSFSHKKERMTIKLHQAAALGRFARRCAKTIWPDNRL